MPKYSAKEYLPHVRVRLGRAEGLSHIRARALDDLLVLESGPEKDPVRHARFRRVTKQYWTLEMPARGRRWETTGMRDTFGNLFCVLVDTFGWMLMPIADEEDNTERTSGVEY